jgi:hypothetical protein
MPNPTSPKIPVAIPGRRLIVANLPCEVTGTAEKKSQTKLVFDPQTGLMMEPIREEWKAQQVKKVGAYLFFPDKLQTHSLANVQIEGGGYVVKTKNWKRTVVEREVSGADGSKAIVIHLSLKCFSTKTMKSGSCYSMATSAMAASFTPT